MNDADIEEPTPPKARPGKAAHAAPNPEAAPKSGGETAPRVDGENMLVAFKDVQPVDVLQSEEKREELYALIRKEIAAQTPDLTTQAGRDRVKSFAYKITRTRTALDAAGKAATADMRKAIEEVNALRNAATTALQALEAEARRPLTEWEEAEEAKAQKRREILDDITQAITWANRPNPPISADECRELIERVRELAIDPDLWAGDADMLTARQAEAVGILEAKLEAADLRDRLAKAEAEAAELRAKTPAEAPKSAAAEPVYPDQDQNLEPTNREEPPPAERSPAELTPTQKARRAVLPVLVEMGIHADIAKKLILAIEAGTLPGVTASYLEQTK